MDFGKPGTNFNGQWNANVSISLTDDFGFAMTAECIGNPNVVAEDANTYATGCQMTRKDILTGSNVYFNTGTKANPVWTLGGGGGVAGVSSLNGLDGDVTLSGGTGINISEIGNDIIITNTGSSTPQSATLSYSGGYLSQILYADSTYKNLTFLNGLIHTITNGTKTKTFSYSGSQLTGWTVS